MNRFDDFEDDSMTKNTPKSIKLELKRDLRRLINLDMCVLDDIKIYKDMLDIDDIDKLDVTQLQDLLTFCTNNRITRDRQNN